MQLVIVTVEAESITSAPPDPATVLDDIVQLFMANVDAEVPVTWIPPAFQAVLDDTMQLVIVAVEE